MSFAWKRNKNKNSSRVINSILSVWRCTTKISLLELKDYIELPKDSWWILGIWRLLWRSLFKVEWSQYQEGWCPVYEMQLMNSAHSLKSLLLLLHYNAQYYVHLVPSLGIASDHASKDVRWSKQMYFHSNKSRKDAS